VTVALCAPGNAGIAPSPSSPRRSRDPDALLALADAQRSISRSSDPSCRSIAASSIASARPDAASSVRRARPRSSSAARSSRRASWRGTGFRPRAIASCESARGRAARDRVGEFGFPVVLKADGLAAGKGVVVAADRAEADDAIRAAMEDAQFGAAGARLVIEECLDGPEVSFFALCDGTRAIPIASAQDHKRIFDDDGAEHRRHGRVRAEPAARRAERRGSCASSSSPCCAACAPKGPEYRGFSTAA
jgi:phosphoribosylamine--glycine ligase